MKIFKIQVENFRSIEFGEFECSDFNIFVGRNNCGKTNLFEAIEWFYQAKGELAQVKYKNATGPVAVEITFSGAQEGAEKMKNPSNKTKILNLLEGSDSITVRRSSSDIKKRNIFINGSEKDPGTGFDAALNDFLPKFEYVSTRQYFDAVCKYDKKSPVGIMLSGVLSAILESNAQYLEFQNRFKELFESEDSEIRIEFDKLGAKVRINLEKQFPDCTNVKFEVTPPHFEDLLKNFETVVDDGIETPAADKGDGMQRALMLAIIQAYALYRKAGDDLGKSFLFFIDEAELHLHPTAQRNLKNVLREIASGTDQVFITTHSSVLVTDDAPGQQILSVDKIRGKTNFAIVTDHERPFVIYELLGGSPSDLLLPANFLIVEGVSEALLLSEIINRHYLEEPKLHIVPADGEINQAERTINSIDRTYSVLSKSLYREKSVILCDKPKSNKQAGYDDFISRNAHLKTNSQVHSLDVESIEESYPSQWKKTPDEVSRMDGHQKKSLAKTVAKSITKDTFEKEMPIAYGALKRAWNLSFKS